MWPRVTAPPHRGEKPPPSEPSCGEKPPEAGGGEAHLGPQACREGLSPRRERAGSSWRESRDLHANSSTLSTQSDARERCQARLREEVGAQKGTGAEGEPGRAARWAGAGATGGPRPRRRLALVSRGSRLSLLCGDEGVISPDTVAPGK